LLEDLLSEKSFNFDRFNAEDAASTPDYSEESLRKKAHKLAQSKAKNLAEEFEDEEQIRKQIDDLCAEFTSQSNDHERFVNHPDSNRRSGRRTKRRSSLKEPVLH